MQYKMKGGYQLTDEDFDRLGEACERGDYPGTPGKWIVKPQGRPAISNESLELIAFKVPQSQKLALDQKAKLLNMTRSQFMRSILTDALQG